MDRDALAQFLRTRRGRLTPEDVGMPRGQHRRTPGLRREEVASIAGISVDYYTRLEQGRGPRPSQQVLTSLSRALQMSDAEHQHLFTLVGEAPAPAGTMSRAVPPGVLRLVDRIDDAAVIVLSAARDLLAANALGIAIFGDVTGKSPIERNFVWMTFVGQQYQRCVVHDDDRRAYAADSARELRAATARYPKDEQLRALVGELLASSAEFAAHWHTHDVVTAMTRSKRLHHMSVGTLELDHQVLLVPEHDQLVIMMTAAPGTPSYESLQLLKVVGTERMGVCQPAIVSAAPAAQN